MINSLAYVILLASLLTRSVSIFLSLFVYQLREPLIYEKINISVTSYIKNALKILLDLRQSVEHKNLMKWLGFKWKEYFFICFAPVQTDEILL